MGRIALLVVLAAAVFAPAAAASTVTVSSTRYGDILVDGKGRVVYLFTKERTAKSRCYGNCATAWPPVLTAGKPRAGKGATAKLVGTTRRKSGKRQVTYNGHPLYYYIADKRPGQITCQDVFEFGGTWLLVTVGGHPVR